LINVKDVSNFTVSTYTGQFRGYCPVCLHSYSKGETLVYIKINNVPSWNNYTYVKTIKVHIECAMQFSKDLSKFLDENSFRFVASKL
jgi:hypothetical protein